MAVKVHKLFNSAMKQICGYQFHVALAKFTMELKCLKLFVLFELMYALKSLG